MILFSAIAAKRGGGVNKILGLLTSVQIAEKVLVRKGGLIDINWTDSNKVVLSKYRLIAEVQALLFCVSRQRVKYINLAGPPPFWTGLSSSRIAVISEISYSQIFYPHVDFRSGKGSIRISFRDAYRRLLMFRLKHIIVQTSLLYDKAQRYFPHLHVDVIKPARPEYIKQVWQNRTALGDRKVRVLFLCSDQRNKRIELFKHYLDLGKLDYELLTTMDPGTIYFQELQIIFNGSLKSVGRKNQDELSDLLESIDVMVNLALLESFSNNLLESWSAGVVLLLPRLQWATEEANDAAFYFDDSNVEESVLSFENMLQDNASMCELISRGKNRLLDYPSYKLKYEHYLSL